MRLAVLSRLRLRDLYRGLVSAATLLALPWLREDRTPCVREVLQDFVFYGGKLWDR